MNSSFFAFGAGEGSVYKLLDTQDIIRRYSIQAAKGDKVLYRQLSFAAFVFAVLFLTGVEDKSDLLLSISVFEPQFF